MCIRDRENSDLYASLPEGVARQLSLDRDPHGNVQVSLIETEKLLSEMVGKKLAEWKAEGKYVGKFAAQHHFFGYEGRCAAPSNYDADYCYSLGYTASCSVSYTHLRVASSKSCLLSNGSDFTTCSLASFVNIEGSVFCAYTNK